MLNDNASRVVALIGFAMTALAGCGGGGGGGGGVITPSYTVTATASANGTITPATTKVSRGATANFTVTPDDGYVVHVTGCGGTLSGTTYTTGPITEACTVTANFSVPYTIGGTVNGLAWGYGLVLHNNGGDAVTVNDTLSASEIFTFPTGIADGASYNVTIASQPAGMMCEVSNGTGTVDAANVTTIAVNCKDKVQALYPANGANWNDYVKNDGANIWAATDTACVGDEVGGYSKCIHGGERRVVAVAGAQSCSGLTAADNLKAFDWRCDGSQGYVRFVSGRLKADKRLADLIDFTTSSWKENMVTVKNGDTVVFTSALTQWWSNPLTVDNDGMTAAEMNAAGTIYLVTTDTRGSYEFGADKVGLVIKPKAMLGRAELATHVASATGKKFLWMEGNVNAIEASNGIVLDSARFSVLRDMKVANAKNSDSIVKGIYLKSAHNNSLQRLNISNCNRGLVLSGSAYNSVTGVTASSNYYGLQLSDYSNNNYIEGLTAVNNRFAEVRATQSYRNIVSTMSLANSATGIEIEDTWGNTYADLAVAHVGVGIKSLRPAYETFTGLFKVGNTTNAQCTVTEPGDSPGLINVVCFVDGTAEPLLTRDISMVTAFVDAVAVDDAENTDDADGYVASYPANPASFDWFRFENEFRAWARNADFPDMHNLGYWGTAMADGEGRIWDWSLAGTDPVLKGALSLPSGSDTITHTWTDGTYSETVTFLRHTVEVDGDADGLCESNETCLYTPNLGAYQGHGTLVSAGAFTDGAITGVTLLKFQNNGR